MPLCEIVGTHGKQNNNTQTLQMKKTLLIAAAALAAGIISTQASSVYSQNIVGYANVVTANNVTYAMSVPFAVGVSNGANEIWPLSSGQPTIPDGSQLMIWNGSGFDTFLSDSGSASLWDDNNGTAIPNSPKLPVGQGFFLIPAGDTTNTFTGSIAIASGTTNNASYANNVTFCIGSRVPYAGAVTNGTSTGGGIALSSLNNLPDGSQLMIWGGSGFTTYLSDSGSSSLWDDNNGTAIPVPPSLSIGQGFFFIPAGDFTWTQGL